MLIDNGYAQISQQTLFEMMSASFIDAYMRHSAAMCIVVPTWKQYDTEVIRTPWRLKPLAIERLFIQQLVRVYNKEHIKDVHC